MNKILPLGFIKQSIQSRYRRYRESNTSTIAVLFTTLYVIGWLFLPLESPNWQWVRKNEQDLFPNASSTSPRFSDFLCYFFGGIWLLLVRRDQPIKKSPNVVNQRIQHVIQRYYTWLSNLPTQIANSHLNQVTSQHLKHMNKTSRHILFVVVGTVAVILALVCITQPLDAFNQFIFVLLLWAIALSIRHIPGRLPIIMLVVLSIIISSRYLWWRYTSTINWNDTFSLVCGLLLILAETYAWIVLLLGYFQTIWPLERPPIDLPVDSSTWPSVDVLIPTYNEDIDIVKPAIYAALGLDWPKNKLNIYLLDDGNRPAFEQFAEEVGVNYIARPTHEHAKAGNINYALKQTKGEFVALFDCDHVVAHTFLQLTLGWFLKDPKLAIVQTPHHFFSADPFERNLANFRRTPNEAMLFYGLVQNGNDTWDATFFCGSCGIFRRTALEEIGGMAVESITEDAHTSLRLQRQGYTSAYIRIPLAAGLATETLAGHIGQHLRWARGMVQIFRLDNPLFGKGLKLAQRLCYSNAMLYFLSGIPRLIFLVAPMAFLLLHAFIIDASVLLIILYAVPHIAHIILTNGRIQGKYRHFFWSEIYETVLAWGMARATTGVLLNPFKSKFNVTAKGDQIRDHIDWISARPCMLLLLFNLIGFVMGIHRLLYGPTDEMGIVFFNLAWVTYNLVMLGGAIAVAIEVKQMRQTHRIDIKMPAAIARADGHLYPCMITDYANNSVGITMQDTHFLQEGDNIMLLLQRGQQEYAFPFQIKRIANNTVGVRTENLSLKQYIAFIQCTFARADTWALWENHFSPDHPMETMRDVLKLTFRGYLSILLHTSLKIRKVF